MMIMKTKRVAKTTIIPLKLDDELAEEVERLAAEVGEPNSTIMRLAIRAGLPKVRAALQTLKPNTAPGAEIRPSHRP
jgi:predicted transcriptional regulator